MKKGYTHIAALLDRSGSMSNIIQDMRGGFISFIEEQKKVQGTLTLSIVQFDTVAETILDFKPINANTKLDLSTYIPRGSTALLDSFCQLIDYTGYKLASMPEADRPEKVLVICITDGQENASHAFTPDQLNQRITRQEKEYNWSFVFLGANQDSFATGGAMGVRGAATMNFNADSQGVSSLYSTLSNRTASYRNRKDNSQFDFNEDDKNTSESN